MTVEERAKRITDDYNRLSDLERQLLSASIVEWQHIQTVLPLALRMDDPVWSDSVFTAAEDMLAECKIRELVT